LVDLTRTLSHALGAPLTPIDAWAHAPVGRGESWQRRWGLPRPSMVGAAAGTCLRFTAAAALNPARVAHAETTGVGTRTAEGYGQIRVNDPLLFQPLAGRSITPVGDTGGGRSSPQDGAATLTAQETRMLRLVERAAWTTAIHTASQLLAATAEGRTRVLGAGHTDVPATQLAGLRAVFTPGGVDPQRWLDSLGGTDIRSRAWPQQVRTHLTALLTDPDTVWRLLDADTWQLSATAQGTAVLRRDLLALARRVLIEDCLTAHLRATQQQQGDR
jgi:CRISPR-associated protein Csx10